jgi:transcriptional regulator with XRE-family HTH domain
MGYARPRPKRLAEKLRQIRLALELSQTEMHRRLETEEQIPYTRISDYELDKNEPSLMTILAYARVAGVHIEDIVDDELDLPSKLPGNVRYQGLKRKSRSQKSDR